MNIYPPKIDKAKPYDLVCFGYNSVDYLCVLERYPRFAEKVRMLELVKAGGGQAATASVAAKRLGLKRVMYVGKFGSDEHGAFSRLSIEAEGVEVVGKIANDARNQIAMIMIDATCGERTITYIRDAGLEIESGEFDSSLFTQTKMLLVDGHNISATLEAARAAHDMGIPIVMDAERIFNGTDKLIEMCWAVIGDEQFCHKFTGIDDEQKALIAISEGKRIAGKTLGARGSLVFDGEKFIRTPALAINAKDTTGAGDVYHAAFCVGAYMGLSIQETLAFANAAAGLACTKIGGRAGIPNYRVAIETAKSLLEQTKIFLP